MNSEAEEETINTNNNNNNRHSIEPIYLNQWIDCCDEYNKWYEAQITSISTTSNRHIKVHYKGWKSKFDTWIDLNNETDFNHVCQLHTHTPIPYKKHTLLSYKIGTKCDCLDSTDKWYEASIVEISSNNKLLKIHYNAWDSKYDEWINKDSYRISPLHTNTQNNNYEIKQEIKHDTQSNEISQSQKDIHRDIQSKYLSNFKPSLLDEEEFSLSLNNIGLYIESMGEDGNCLFRSISHQVYGKQDFHMIIRKKCCEYLRSEYEYFGSYVPGGHDREIFNAYCLRMEVSGIWGDNLEIQAFSEIYGRSIQIYAYDDKPMKTFTNDSNKQNNIPIRLSYHCNSHYNSIINPQNFEENIISSDKIGECEDEKIRLSSLRSIHASQKTLNISDIEATELQLFNKILQLSRKNFNKNGNDDNKQLDSAIKKSLKSLKEYENKSVQNAVKESLYQQEQNEIEIALKKSQYDFIMNDNNNMNDNGLTNKKLIFKCANNEAINCISKPRISKNKNNNHINNKMYIGCDDGSVIQYDFYSSDIDILIEKSNINKIMDENDKVSSKRDYNNCGSCICMQSCDDFVVIGYSSGFIKIVQKSELSFVIKQIAMHRRMVTSVAILDEMCLIATVSEDGYFHVIRNTTSSVDVIRSGYFENSILIGCKFLKTSHNSLYHQKYKDKILAVTAYDRNRIAFA